MEIEEVRYMSVIQDILNNSKKIVIKIGSNVLSDDKGYVKKGAIDNIVDQIYELIKVGKRVVIVSSGAGACGMGTILPDGPARAGRQLGVPAAGDERRGDRLHPGHLPGRLRLPLGAPGLDEQPSLHCYSEQACN